jgi:hypothetical protein
VIVIVEPGVIVKIADVVVPVSVKGYPHAGTWVVTVLPSINHVYV